VGVGLCACVRVCVLAFVCTCVRDNNCARVLIHVCVFVRVRVCVRARMQIHVCIYIYIYIYNYIYICIYIYIYLYIYIYKCMYTASILINMFIQKGTDRNVGQRRQRLLTATHYNTLQHAPTDLSRLQRRRASPMAFTNTITCCSVL